MSKRGPFHLDPHQQTSMMKTTLPIRSSMVFNGAPLSNTLLAQGAHGGKGQYREILSMEGHVSRQQGLPASPPAQTVLTANRLLLSTTARPRPMAELHSTMSLTLLLMVANLNCHAHVFCFVICFQAFHGLRMRIQRPSAWPKLPDECLAFETVV